MSRHGLRLRAGNSHRAHVVVLALTALLAVGATHPAGSAAPEIRVVGPAIATATHQGEVVSLRFPVRVTCPAGKTFHLLHAGVPGLRDDGALSTPSLPGHTAPTVVDCTGEAQFLTGFAHANPRNQAPAGTQGSRPSDEWAVFDSRVTLMVGVVDASTASGPCAAKDTRSVQVRVPLSSLSGE